MSSKASLIKLTQIMSVEGLTSLDVPKIVGIAAAQFGVAGATYLNAAKSMIALSAKGVALPDIKLMLAEEGVTKSQIKNAMQAVDAWDALVALKYVTEAWFDELTYGDFVLVNRAVRRAVAEGRKGAELFAEYWPKPIAHTLHVFEEFCETGKTPADIEADKAKAAKVLADAAAQAAGTDVTPGATPVESVKVTDEKKAKPTKTPEEAAMSTIEAAEKAVLGLIDVAADAATVERIVKRLVSMQMATAAARAKKFPAVDLSAARELAQHVTS